MSGNVFIPPSYPVCLKIESKVENTSLRSLKAFFHFSSCILSVVLLCLCFSTVLLKKLCCHFYSSRWICNLFIPSLFSESFFLSHILCNVTPVSFSVGPLVYAMLSASWVLSIWKFMSYSYGIFLTDFFDDFPLLFLLLFGFPVIGMLVLQY